MKKLKLNIEDLKVETFITSSSSIQPRGTVKGYATLTQGGPNCTVVDPTCISCEGSCAGSCYQCGTVDCTVAYSCEQASCAFTCYVGCTEFPQCA